MKIYKSRECTDIMAVEDWLFSHRLMIDENELEVISICPNVGYGKSTVYQYVIFYSLTVDDNFDCKGYMDKRVEELRKKYGL